MPPAYRTDIDGLRAIAVASVLAFHAFPGVLPGGFTGVDIFFVISGYLISGIILSELRDGSFTFANFYARRIRRIFPALALVLAATLGFGWWSLSPYDYDQLGAYVGRRGGIRRQYSALERERLLRHRFGVEAPLHLWSLGVEEQYYLLWPLMLFLMRARLRRILWLIIASAWRPSR